MSAVENNRSFYVVFILNFGNALFGIGVSILSFFGISTDMENYIYAYAISIASLIICAALLYVSVMMLWPAKENGWAFALLLNIAIQPCRAMMFALGWILYLFGNFFNIVVTIVTLCLPPMTPEENETPTEITKGSAAE
jgi:hypothetical protein